MKMACYIAAIGKLRFAQRSSSVQKFQSKLQDFLTFLLAMYPRPTVSSTSPVARLQIAKLLAEASSFAMEPRSGFEPETPSLPWKCSTTELSRHKVIITQNLDLGQNSHQHRNLCYNHGDGVVAHLVERSIRIAEVGRSSRLHSTIFHRLISLKPVNR